MDTLFIKSQTSKNQETSTNYTAATDQSSHSRGATNRLLAQQSSSRLAVTAYLFFATHLSTYIDTNDLDSCT